MIWDWFLRCDFDDDEQHVSIREFWPSVIQSVYPHLAGLQQTKQMLIRRWKWRVGRNVFVTISETNAKISKTPAAIITLNQQAQAINRAS